MLLGLIGRDIQRSRTPEMHMREGEAQGIRCVYRLLDLAVLKLRPEALPDLLSQAERLGYDGLNITHPCKTLVLEHLTEIAPEAAAIGAVNTVLLRGGKRIGHNTDASGFSAGFSRALADAPRRRVVLFGAGGAGAAVAHAALGLGTGTLHIVDLEPGRAESLAAALSARFGAGRALAATEAADAVAAADGIINATPVGMAAYPGLPLPQGLLRPDLWVAEIVYFPLETALLATARALGCRTLDGSGMAVFQAVDAFRLFSGHEPDPARMRHTFEALGNAG
ncbi:MAG: shikimate dehydrogenase [Janthinobacterium lividum]